MAALGGFKVPDFLHFCQRFKKPSHFQKADCRQKSRVIFKKPAKFWRVVPFEKSKARENVNGTHFSRHSPGISGSFEMSQL
jgi:hypothetical protein